MKYSRSCLLVTALLLSGSPVIGAEILVNTQAEYNEAVAAAKPGDTIKLANGQWNDFEILFTGEGRPQSPITLTAETKGEVIVTGQSNLRIAGRHLVVSGLVFRDGYTPTSTVISFRKSKGELAYNSRVTETVIDHFNNPERYEPDSWVMLYGRNNRFDHNHLVGKNNQGVTMAVRMDSEESQRNRHRIDHNYFGPRPVLGSNGGETLRIGTSHHSLNDSLTRVENNYFERCDGEVEIISSKSGGNEFIGNVFIESRGTLTLRHGNNARIENNIFLGNGVDHTGGIRVINRGQTVRNNYMEGLTGHRFGGALVIMNGVPDSPINRYHQVRDAVVERNSIIDSEHIELAAGADEERSAPPVASKFRHNLVYHRDGLDPIAVHDDISGIRFSDNVINAAGDAQERPGFRTVDLTLERAANGLQYPTDKSLNKVGVSRDLAILPREATGVDWYAKPGPVVGFDSGPVIEAADADALTAAVTEAPAGAVVRLAPGQHTLSRTLTIRRPVTIEAAEPGQASLSFERASAFEIIEGGSLKLRNLEISGSAAPDRAGNSVIRTKRSSMSANYALVLDHVTISDLDINHSFNLFTAARHTFADRIEIRDSTIRNVTGTVLALNAEREDLGIYNAEYITITDSRFEQIGGAVADVYRGGTDESTFGPHFELQHSTLDNVGKARRNATQASIRLWGVQATHIHGNRLIDSLPIRVMHTVGDPVTRLGKNRFKDTSEPVITQIERS